MKPMKKMMLTGLAAGLLGTAPLHGAAPTAWQTPADTLSYALGRLMGASLMQPGGTPLGRELNRPLFFEALSECLDEQSGRMTDEEAAQFMQRYVMALQQKQAAGNKRSGEAFLASNRQQPGVQVTASGLQYRVEKEGDGPKPTADDVVSIHYTMKHADGSTIDSSAERGEPMDMPLSNLIAGVIEGVQLMPLGSKYVFYLPAELAYGERGAGGVIQPNEVLVFEVELLGIDPGSPEDAGDESTEE